MADVLYGEAFAEEFGQVRTSKFEAVDAAPFLGWLDSWQRSQGRRSHAVGAPSQTSGWETLAELAGVSERSIRRARASGRVSRTIVDRVLIAAGGDTMLSHLYPEH